jgi:outer membrane protein TolC
LKGLGAVVNRAAIRVANLNADVSYEQFRRKVIEVVADVTALYWQMVYEGELVRIDRESLDLAQEVLRREEVRFRQGISKEVDVARAQAAAGVRQTRLVRSETRLRNTVERLKLLLNAREVPLDSEVIVVPAERLAYRVTDVVRSEAVSKALAHRPDLAGARKAIEANQVRVDAARHERLPKLDALLRYTMNGLNTDLGDALEDQHLTDPFSWVAGLEFELPVGNRAADAEHRKRRFEYQQSLLEADLVASRAIQEVNVAVRTVNTARAEVDAARRARDAAAATVKGENVRFELNQVANQDLLIAQDVLAAAERDYFESVLNFNLAMTELGRAQGTLLDDQSIEIIHPKEDRAKRPEPLRVRPRDDPGAHAMPAAEE